MALFLVSAPLSRAQSSRATDTEIIHFELLSQIHKAQIEVAQIQSLEFEQEDAQIGATPLSPQAESIRMSRHLRDAAKMILARIGFWDLSIQDSEQTLQANLNREDWGKVHVDLWKQIRAPGKWVSRKFKINGAGHVVAVLAGYGIEAGVMWFLHSQGWNGAAAMVSVFQTQLAFNQLATVLKKAQVNQAVRKTLGDEDLFQSYLNIRGQIDRIVKTMEPESWMYTFERFMIWGNQEFNIDAKDSLKRKFQIEIGLKSASLNFEAIAKLFKEYDFAPKIVNSLELSKIPSEAKTWLMLFWLDQHGSDEIIMEFELRFADRAYSYEAGLKLDPRVKTWALEFAQSRTPLEALERLQKIDRTILSPVLLATLFKNVFWPRFIRDWGKVGMIPLRSALGDFNKLYGESLVSMNFDLRGDWIEKYEALIYQLTSKQKYCAGYFLSVL